MADKVTIHKGSNTPVDYGPPGTGGFCDPQYLDRNALVYDSSQNRWVERQPDGFQLIYKPMRCDGALPCPTCGDVLDPLLSENPSPRTPRYLDVEFHFVCPCLCGQCFVCGTKSYKVVRSPVHGYIDNRGTPTDPNDDVEVFRTVRVVQNPLSPCQWVGTIEGLVLDVYDNGSCSGTPTSVTVPIKVRVTKLTGLTVDLASNKPTDADWRVEAWAELMADNPVPGLPPIKLCDLWVFDGAGPGCGCTMPASVPNQLPNCPDREMDPLIPPDGNPTWWTPCDKDRGSSCKPVVNAPSISISNHEGGSAVIRPCKQACPSDLDVCPECDFDSPKFIGWSWQNMGYGCCPPGAGSVYSLSTWPSGRAERVAACTWTCYKLGAFTEQVTGPNCEREPDCPIDTTDNGHPGCGGNPNPPPVNSSGGVSPSDARKQGYLITVIKKIATGWEVTITHDGVVVFFGTNVSVSRDCSVSSVTVFNTIPPCQSGIRAEPGGGSVVLYCDPCNCETAADHCNPNCCSEQQSGCAGCYPPHGPGDAVVSWSAHHCFDPVPGHENNSGCDCYGTQIDGSPAEACYMTPAFKVLCQQICSGTEVLKADSCMGWSRTRCDFYRCTIGSVVFSFDRTVSVSWDACSRRLFLLVSLFCRKDCVGDFYPTLCGTLKNIPCCPQSVSGVIDAEDSCGCCPTHLLRDENGDPVVNPFTGKFQGANDPITISFEPDPSAFPPPGECPPPP